jgi:ribosomal protein L44E
LIGEGRQNSAWVTEEALYSLYWTVSKGVPCSKEQYCLLLRLFTYILGKMDWNKKGNWCLCLKDVQKHETHQELSPSKKSPHSPISWGKDKEDTKNKSQMSNKLVKVPNLIHENTNQTLMRYHCSSVKKSECQRLHPSPALR